MIFILCLLLGIPFINAELYCPPAAPVGFSYSIKYTVNQTSTHSDVLYWSFRTRYLIHFILWICLFEKYPCERYSVLPSTRTTANITDLGNNITESLITIHDISSELDGAGIVIGVSDFLQLDSCTIKAYDFRSTLSCDKPYLENQGSNTSPDIYVIVPCSISNVYPEPLCEFPGFGNEQVTVHDVTNSTVTNGYFDRQCTLRMSVADLEPKEYQFQVIMYPNVTNGKDYGKMATSDAIDLWYPETRLVNCPNGPEDYIKQGTTATCTCYRSVEGKPPGKAQWVLPNDTVVGNAITAVNSTLRVTYDSQGANPQLYYCQADTPLRYGNNPRVPFSPKFAYGPASITQWNVPELTNLCDPSDTISITCTIDRTTVNPEPIVNIKVEGMNDLNPISTQHTTGRYSFEFSFRPQPVKENLFITCKAYNFKFAELSAETRTQITVREPPKQKPVISIYNRRTIASDGQVVNVTTGQPVQVQCDVQGGVPSVTSVTVTCDSRQPVTTQETRTSLSMFIDKTNNNEKCLCTAQHPSGCYHESTEFTFNVHFGPENVQATVNTPQIKLCPSQKESIDMHCDVATIDVNPKPTVVVKSLNDVIQSSEEERVSGNYRFHFSFIPTNGGILTTTCVATNPFDKSLEKEDSKIVLALEPPSSHPSVSVDGNTITNPNGQQVDVTSGQPVRIQCEVQGGFPAVTKVLMTCASIQYETEATLLTQSFILNETNNNDKCSCHAEHSSACYDLSTNFTFNVQYISRVTDFRAGNDMLGFNSPELKVNVTSTVKFECEAEGNPRPEVKVKGQNKIFSLQSQTISLGDYTNRAVASKSMECDDTAYYVCQASNTIGQSTNNKAILVTVLCTPELPEEDRTSEPKTFTYPKVDGTDLKIDFKILGHPPPTAFILFKVEGRSKRSTEDGEIEPGRYNATYTPLDELYGRVELVMYGLTDRDDGEYEMVIRNGIGDGLRYSFYVDGQKEDDNSSSNRNAVVVGGISAAVAVLVVGVVVVLVLRHKGVICKKKEAGIYENEKPHFNVHFTPGRQLEVQGRSTEDTDERGQSSNYTEVDTPPSKPKTPHYVEIDDDFSPPQTINQSSDESPHSYDYADGGPSHTASAISNLNDTQTDRDPYANEESLRHVESSEDQGHTYDHLQESHYQTPGTPYERIARPAQTTSPTTKKRAYVNWNV